MVYAWDSSLNLYFTIKARAASSAVGSLTHKGFESLEHLAKQGQPIAERVFHSLDADVVTKLDERVDALVSGLSTLKAKTSQVAAVSSQAISGTLADPVGAVSKHLGGTPAELTTRARDVLESKARLVVPAAWVAGLDRVILAEYTAAQQARLARASAAVRTLSGVYIAGATARLQGHGAALAAAQKRFVDVFAALAVEAYGVSANTMGSAVAASGRVIPAVRASVDGAVARALSMEEFTERVLVRLTAAMVQGLSPDADSASGAINSAASSSEDKPMSAASRARALIASAGFHPAVVALCQEAFAYLSALNLSVPAGVHAAAADAIGQLRAHLAALETDVARRAANAGSAASALVRSAQAALSARIAAAQTSVAAAATPAISVYRVGVEQFLRLAGAVSPAAAAATPADSAGPSSAGLTAGALRRVPSFDSFLRAIRARLPSALPLSLPAADAAVPEAYIRDLYDAIIAAVAAAPRSAPNMASVRNVGAHVSRAYVSLLLDTERRIDAWLPDGDATVVAGDGKSSDSLAGAALLTSDSASEPDESGEDGGSSDEVLPVDEDESTLHVVITPAEGKDDEVAIAMHPTTPSAAAAAAALAGAASPVDAEESRHIHISGRRRSANCATGNDAPTPAAAAATAACAVATTRRVAARVARKLHTRAGALRVSASDRAGALVADTVAVASAASAQVGAAVSALKVVGTDIANSKDIGSAVSTASAAVDAAILTGTEYLRARCAGLDSDIQRRRAALEQAAQGVSRQAAAVTAATRDRVVDTAALARQEALALSSAAYARASATYADAHARLDAARASLSALAQRTAAAAEQRALPLTTAARAHAAHTTAAVATAARSVSSAVATRAGAATNAVVPQWAQERLAASLRLRATELRAAVGRVTRALDEERRQWDLAFLALANHALAVRAAAQSEAARVFTAGTLRVTQIRIQAEAILLNARLSLAVKTASVARRARRGTRRAVRAVGARAGSASQALQLAAADKWALAEPYVGPSVAGAWTRVQPALAMVDARLVQPARATLAARAAELWACSPALQLLPVDSLGSDSESESEADCADAAAVPAPQGAPDAASVGSLAERFLPRSAAGAVSAAWALVPAPVAAYAEQSSAATLLRSVAAKWLPLSAPASV